MKKDAGNSEKPLSKILGTNLFWTAIVLSLLLHGGYYFHISSLAPKPKNKVNWAKLKKRTPSPIKIRFVPKKKQVVKNKKDAEPDRKLLEVHQEKTEAPKDFKYLGQVDHIAQKDQKLKKQKVTESKALAPGQAKQKAKKNQKPKSIAKQQGSKNTKTKKADPKQAKQSNKNPKKVTMAKSKKLVKKVAKQSSKASPNKFLKLNPNFKAKKGLSITSRPEPIKDIGAQGKARNNYEKFLNTGFSQMGGQIEAGYQDYLTDKMEEGQRIDINTRQYRYIGYFTNLRKSIEMVWNYPKSAAMRGLQGTVGLEFSIGLNGRARGIKVVKSSGYAVLDDAIVDAIRLASPFAPLPKGFKKSKLLVSGNFNYVLGYGMAH